LSARTLKSGLIQKGVTDTYPLYDLQAILTVYCSINPATGKIIENRNYVNNHCLRGAIEDYLAYANKA
jgi:hypothetical protein